MKTSGLRRQAILALGGFAVALLARCGGDTPSTPAAPPAAPAPPGVTAVTFLTLPFDSIGWVVGETIRIQVLFSEPVSVSGSPRLALGIGAETRFAGFAEQGSSGAFVTFDYGVTRDDRDEDGVSVEADALDLNGGTIRSAGGLDADLDLGSHAVENDPLHLVVGAPPQQECTDERERALTFSRFVGEWDGTAFRVDMIRNFPDFVTEADLAELFAPVGLLADKIERQLGYRIVEMGEVVSVPEGMRPDWDQDAVRRLKCLLPRERGQILGFYGDGLNTTGRPRARAQAHVSCGVFMYLRPAIGAGRWPCPGCFLDGVTIHEIFHVLGFMHADDHGRLARGDGVAMSREMTWPRSRGAQDAVWTDIDLLRCIFPEGG